MSQASEINLFFCVPDLNQVSQKSKIKTVLNHHDDMTGWDNWHKEW